MSDGHEAVNDYSAEALLAQDIAHEVSALLLDLAARTGLEGRALCAAGDRDANALILERLHAERPDDAVLSEESADDLSRLARSRVWIVDPLDGTR